MIEQLTKAVENMKDTDIAELTQLIQSWTDFKNSGGTINGQIKTPSVCKHIPDTTIPDWTALNLALTCSGTENIQLWLGKLGGISSLVPDKPSSVSLGIPSQPFKDVHVGEVSKTVNGYCTLPNGMLMQWGYVTAVSPALVVFSKSFTASNTYTFHVTPCGEVDATGLNWRTTATGKDRITIVSTKNYNWFWLAIGW